MSACPNCGVIKTRVLDTRVLRNGWTRRSRLCAYGCASRWQSYEIPAANLKLDADEDELAVLTNKGVNDE